MVGEEEIEENTQSVEFDMERELQSLVESKMVPQQIADKLLVKLQENNLSLTKDQLYTLINKINQVIVTYKKNKERTNKMDGDGMTETENTTQQSGETMADIHALFDKIDYLQEQIEQLKSEKPQSVQEGTLATNDPVSEGQESATVTTADIIVPDDSMLSSNSFSTDPLSVIPHNPESIIVLMNWLQYLIDQCGYQNLDIILEYYVDINWITDDVKMGLLDYSKGIKKENMKTTTKSGTSKDAKEQTILPSRDHIQSYMFIQKLKGKKFDKHFVDKIQNDLTRLRNKIDQYQ